MVIILPKAVLQFWPPENGPAVVGSERHGHASARPGNVRPSGSASRDRAKCLPLQLQTCPSRSRCNPPEAESFAKEVTPLPRELFELASEIFFFRSCDIEMDSAARMASREPSVLGASNQR